MYFRIVLGFVSTFFTSKYSFSSGVGYAIALYYSQCGQHSKVSYCNIIIINFISIASLTLAVF